MTIPRLDKFLFQFNNGRGIDPTQVDWTVTDTQLQTFLAALTGSGNTSYSLTAAPDDTVGVDGDTATVLVSPTQLAGYLKSGGAWTQVWMFSGGGGGLGTAAVQALLDGANHATDQDLIDHNAANTAHTVIRQRIDTVEQSVPSNQDIQDYVDSGVAQHAGVPNAHHAPPVVSDAANGFLPLTAEGQLQTPSAETVGRASVFGRQVYVYTLNPGTPGEDEVWDWDAMTTHQIREGTGTNNAFWRGTHSNEDAIGSPADGHYAYITNRHRLRRYEGGWEDASSIRMQGDFLSQADAQAHITTVNAWAWWPGPQGLQFLASYTPPTTAIPDTYAVVRTGYSPEEWIAQFRATNVQDLANVPAPQARSYLRWNEDGDAIENAASPADEAVGDAKGPIWAVSPTLTTGVTYANNMEIPFPGTEHWNLTNDAVGGVAHGTGATRGQLAMPAEAPTGIIGVWIQARINGVIEDEAALVYGHGNAFHSEQGASDIHLRLDDGGTFFLQARWQRADYIALYGADTTIPANVTVAIRPMLIRGAQGEAGDATAAVTTHNADGSAHDDLRTDLSDHESANPVHIEAFNSHNNSNVAHAGAIVGNVSAHNQSNNSHQDIRAAETAHEANANSHAAIRSAISNEIDNDVSAHNLQSGAHFTEFEAEFDSHNASSNAHSSIRSEIDSDVTAHNADASAHPGLAGDGGDVTAHNADATAHSAAIAEDILEHDESQLAHEFIRNLITDRVEISDWLHNTTYYIGQTVIDGGHFYLCIVSHESGGTRTGTRGAPPNNPDDWRRIQLFGDSLIQVGSAEDVTLTTSGVFVATSIRPIDARPVPTWLHIRPGLVQAGHGIHGEYVRIKYSEWVNLPNVTNGGTRQDANNIVLGNFGAMGGVEMYIGRTSAGDVAVTNNNAGFDIEGFEVWGE